MQSSNVIHPAFQRHHVNTYAMQKLQMMSTSGGHLTSVNFNPQLQKRDQHYQRYTQYKQHPTYDLADIQKLHHLLPVQKSGALSYGIDRILSETPRNSPTSSSRQVDDVMIPEGLEVINRESVSKKGIRNQNNFIPTGTRFGPYNKQYPTLSCLWMSHVKFATHQNEQNLIISQIGDDIYYVSCRRILPHQQLLVWYAPSGLSASPLCSSSSPPSSSSSASQSASTSPQGTPLSRLTTPPGMRLATPLNTPQTTPSTASRLTSPRQQLVQTAEIAAAMQTGSEDGEGYQCQRCGKVFTYRYYRDKHLKYTRCVDQGNRKFPCALCSRSFEKRDRLRIHVLHVHEKHRPHKCNTCGKSFSQSSSLNKHMRVHSGERPYKCVYCSKAFTASSILRTHIRQHSGEKPFKCKYCGKSFASHAAHDSHVRRTHTSEVSNCCPVCKLQCLELSQLKAHMKSHHVEIGQDIPKSQMFC